MQLYEIYEEYQNEIMRYAKSVTRHKELAENLVQLAYLKALDQSELFAWMHSQQIKAWFFTTIKRSYIEEYRKQLRLVFADFIPDDGYSDNVENALMVEKVMEALPDGLKTIVSLKYI